MPSPKQGMKRGESISVVGLRLGEAAQKLQQSYGVLKRGDRVDVVIERGTLDQLLGR
jgi:hypothetical protein